MSDPVNAYQYKSPVQSESYIQYASGYNKDNVTQEDLDKALIDILDMDDEHGAFWISMVMEEEHVVEVDKGRKLSIMFGDNVELKHKARSWDEVRVILNLLLAEEFEEILQIVER